MVRLVKPNVELEKEYLSFYEEWKESGEDMVPWVISQDPSDFPKMLRLLSNNERSMGQPEGRVQNSTFWLVDKSNKVLGAVNIRHQLTPHLYNAGGHIGYGIRPSERLKGYATKLLELSLSEAKKIGIKEVLVVCDADNMGSERTIMKNGGRADADYIEDDGNIIKRYWINIV